METVGLADPSMMLGFHYVTQHSQTFTSRHGHFKERHISLQLIYAVFCHIISLINKMFQRSEKFQSQTKYCDPEPKPDTRTVVFQ